MATTFQNIAPCTSKEEFPDQLDSDAMLWAPHNNLSVAPMAQDVPSYHFPMPYNQETATPYKYDPAAFNENYHLTYQPPLASSCPRSYASTNGFDLTAVPGSAVKVEGYPPPVYQMRPQQPYEGVDVSQSPNVSLMQLDEYDEYPISVKQQDNTPYSTPYDSEASRSSTPYGSSPLFHHDEGPIDKDLPYAQLIYRALLDAPNNTMILRDIYEWFKAHTDKAADKETNGWQNSIRHNLSMNGAFEKVDQPCEESRKGFMWRLTQEAIDQGGVKSTTRYRSKQPNKRRHRSGHPQVQRQRSGAKGGLAAKNAARMRKTRNDTYRSDPFQSRSMAAPTVFDTTYNSEISMPYSPSPYYSSSGSEVDHSEYPRDIYGHHAIGEQRLDMMQHNFHNPRPAIMPPNYHDNFIEGPPSDMMQQSFHGLPLSTEQDMSMGYGNTGYVQLPMDPSEPLFSNSPTPSASEPRTPPSTGGDWSDHPFGSMSGGDMGSFVCDGAYDEFV